MSYFKINDIDFSNMVNALKIGKTASYSSQVNALGDSLVDYINSKRTIEVGIIPLNAEAKGMREGIALGLLKQTSYLK